MKEAMIILVFMILAMGVALCLTTLEIESSHQNLVFERNKYEATIDSLNKAKIRIFKAFDYQNRRVLYLEGKGCK